MKPHLLPRLFFVFILFAALLFALPALGGLPGPEPPDPPAIPTPPPDGDFDYVKVDDARGQSGITTQIEIGTSGKDKIVEYGGKDDITQYINGLAANDWFLQVGGEKATSQAILSGPGDDTIYQYGGQGYSQLSVDGGTGNDTIIQVGGQGDNHMATAGGDGNDHIEVYGGSGNNVILAEGGPADDVIKIYGGPRRNSIEYTIFLNGIDLVTVLGGGRHNTLDIHYSSENNFILKDYEGRILYKSGVNTDPPSAAPVAVLSETVGSVTAGQHAVRVSFVTAQGETPPGPASGPVLADGVHALGVSQIPRGPDGVTARKIYMTRVGETMFWLAGTLNDNTTDTFVITVQDADLGPHDRGLTTFTLANLNRIRVLDVDSNIVWQYSSGGGASAVALLLLLLGN